MSQNPARSGAAIYGELDDVATVDAQENGLGRVRITAKRAIHVNLRDASGAEIASFGGGAEYTEGDTDASITGKAILWEDAGNTLRPVSVSTRLPVASTLTDGVDVADIIDFSNSNALAVAIVDSAGDPISSFGGGIQYTEGDTDASITGTAMLWEDGGNTLRPVSTSLRLPVAATLTDGTDIADILDLSNSNPLAVAIVDSNGDQIASFGGGIQYTQGDTDATITGTVAMMEVGSDTLQPVQGTVADGLLVNLGANNDVTVTGSVTANAGTNLNTSLLALESGGNLAAAATSLAAIDLGIPAALGQAAMAASMPVVIASNQSAVPISAASLPLPTGAATEATLALVLAETSSIAAEDFATQTTLAAINAKLVSGTDIGDVTINNAAGASAVNIQDGGNTITVDGTVAATQSGAWSVRLTDGTDTADIFDLANSNPLSVAIVDASGDQITSFGGGVQYTEGATDASITGTAMLMEGAADTLLPVQGTVADGLLVNLGSNNDVVVSATNLDIRDLVFASDKVDVSGSTLGANSGVDIGDVTINNATLAVTQSGAWTVTANAGTNLNTSALALESGGNLAAAAASLSVLDDWDETNRAAVNIIAGQVGVQGASGTVNALTQRVVLATDVALPTGSNIIGALSANQSVNISQMNGVTVTMGNGASGTGVQRVTIADNSTGNIATIGTSVTPGTAAANLGKAEDGAHTSGDVGVMALAVRNDLSATSYGANNDYTPLTTDAQGRAYVKNWTQESASQTLTALNITYTSTTTVESADITTTGYRYCDIFFTIVSAGSPGLMTVKAVGRISSTNFDLDNDWPASWYYSDASVTTTRNIWLANIPVPKCGTMRFTVQCAGVDGAGNNYVISNCQVFLGT